MKMPELPGVEVGELAKLPWTPPKFTLKMVCLADVLANPCWGEGEMKGERCLKVYWKPGRVWGTVQVGRPSLKLEASAADADEFLAALEASLRLDVIPWQADPYPLMKEPRRRK